MESWPLRVLTVVALLTATAGLLAQYSSGGDRLRNFWWYLSGPFGLIPGGGGWTGVLVSIVVAGLILSFIVRRSRLTLFAAGLGYFAWFVFSGFALVT